MGGLEEDVQIETGFVAFVLLKNSGDDGARKAGFGGDKRESLGWQYAGVGLLRCRSVRNGRLVRCR